MKKLTLILVGLMMALGCRAQESDSLSLKEHIFYHYDRSEFSEVVKCCEEALAVYIETEDLFEMAGCYNIMGIAYQRLGRYKEAIESYGLCAETMERLKASEVALHKEGAAEFYDKNIRYTYNNMAAIYWEMDEYDEAGKLYRKCIEMLGEPHDTIDYLDLATYWQNLSAVALKQEVGMEAAEKEQSLKEAVALAEQALELSQQYGDLPFKRISKILMLSQAYHAVGRTQEALALADEALTMAEAENDPYMQTEIHSVYGGFEADEGHYEAAEHHYRQAADIATENHFDEMKRTALDGAYAAARHFDKALALDYFEQSTTLKDSVFTAEQQQLVRDYQVKYDLAEKEHQLELQKEKNHYDKMMIIFLLILAALLLVLLVVGFRLGYIRKQQNKALAKLNKTKDHLFSVVTHDFKTSVLSQNLILDVMGNYIDEMPKEEVKAKVLTLKSSAEALKEKMFNLIEWMKVELGGEGNIQTEFSLSAAVDECIATQKTEIASKRLKMVNAVAPSLLANDDANMVKLVLRNLLSNAVKFSWPDGEVRIEAQEEKGKIWVTVADHGVGISAERQEFLLNEMITPSQGTQGETGSGIGLKLCKQLLDRSGGDILLESKTGEGTTVKFSVNK